ncbi:MPN316 family protein [Mycoplasmoides alvi]|uniref:MPN316 family protein n=1 Tax=Mycoplasmoides alvi TaxID=78580 RepID=UPI00051B4442|nr:hypothetical protein [Mycoplasmoides alvi]
MYNLKTVSVAISLNEEKINLVVSDNTNGSFNLLYTNSVLNDNFYSNEKINNEEKFIEAIFNLLKNASDAIDLKITKIILSFDGLINSFNIHKIKTGFFIYKSPEMIYSKINEAIDLWVNKTINLSENSKIISWKISNWVDINNQKVLDTNLKNNSKYRAKINVYTTNSFLVDKVVKLIESLNVNVINVSLCCLNSTVLTKKQNELLIEIHENDSHVLLLSNGVIEHSINLNFSIKQLNEYIALKINNNLLNFSKIKEIISDILDYNDENESNLIFSRDSKFLKANYLKKKEISSLIKEYIYLLINHLNKTLDLTKFNNIFVMSDYQTISNHFVKCLNELNIANLQIFNVKNNFMLLDNEYYLTALSVIYFNQKQKYKLFESCVEPYYSDVYDQKMQAKLKAMTINTNITQIVQKFIK